MHTISVNGLIVGIDPIFAITPCSLWNKPDIYTEGRHSKTE
jgi:hypothetical protein